MKTKTFFFICLLTGIGLTQLSAQNGKNGNGATTFHDAWPGILQPIYCNGVWIDDLWGDLTTHTVAFWVDGECVKTIEQWEGEFKSDKTGEIFKIISSPERDTYTPFWTNTWHYNLLGTSGTRYIGSMYMDNTNGIFKVYHAVCVEKGPKK